MPKIISGHSARMSSRSSYIRSAMTKSAVIGEITIPINHRELMDDLLHHVQGDQLRSFLGVIPDHLDRQASLGEYAESIGIKHGVSGYINHTVPVAIYAILRWSDNPRRAIEESVILGGDTDTVGAIVGGVMGAVHGTAAIPNDWLSKLFEWPRSVNWMTSLAEELGRSIDHPDQTKPQLFSGRANCPVMLFLLWSYWLTVSDGWPRRIDSLSCPANLRCFCRIDNDSYPFREYTRPLLCATSNPERAACTLACCRPTGCRVTWP